MIVLFGMTKGGTGKSTLACHMALRRAMDGCDVLLVDGDRQGSASLWAELRGQKLPGITCVQKFGKSLAKEVLSLAKRFDDVVIDCGGYDSVELRSALTCAQHVFIPARPGQFDATAIVDMDDLVNKARGFNEHLQATVVVSGASPNPTLTKEIAAVGTFVNEYCPELKLSQNVIHDRTSFRRVIETGTIVHEEPSADYKAKAEIDHLYEEVFNG